MPDPGAPSRSICVHRDGKLSAIWPGSWGSGVTGSDPGRGVNQARGVTARPRYPGAPRDRMQPTTPTWARLGQLLQVARIWRNMREKTMIQFVGWWVMMLIFCKNVSWSNYLNMNSINKFKKLTYFFYRALFQSHLPSYGEVHATPP